VHALKWQSLLYRITELPRADMADRAAVTLLDRFHQQFDEHGRFAAQFLEIDVGAVGWRCVSTSSSSVRAA